MDAGRSARESCAVEASPGMGRDFGTTLTMNTFRLKCMGYDAAKLKEGASADNA